MSGFGWLIMVWFPSEEVCDSLAALAIINEAGEPGTGESGNRGVQEPCWQRQVTYQGTSARKNL